MRLYRVWGGLAQRVGSRLSVNRPSSSEEARKMLMLPPENLALWLTEVELPAGTPLELVEGQNAQKGTEGWPLVECLDPVPDDCFGLTLALESID